LTSKDFFDKCLCLDIETSGNETIFHLGAIRGDVAFERKGRFDLQSSLRELDSLAEPAQYILGHNLLGHDLPILESQAPQLKLLKKPVIDTLYLSPLVTMYTLPKSRSISRLRLLVQVVREGGAVANESYMDSRRNWRCAGLLCLQT